MKVPAVKYASVVLHIMPSADFVQTFGAKVKAAGGKYTECRGHVSTRYVTVPSSSPDLIDAIMERFAFQTKRTTVIVEDLHGEGYSSHGLRQVAGTPGRTVYYWDRECGLPPSRFVEESFRRNMASINWEPILQRWSAEAEQQDAANKARRLQGEIAELREKIAAEAVRILNGANDLDPIKELAERYQEACYEAGIEIEEPSLPTP